MKYLIPVSEPTSGLVSPTPAPLVPDPDGQPRSSGVAYVDGWPVDLGTAAVVKSIRKVNAGEIWLDSHTTAAVMRQFASPADALSGPSNGKARERSPLSTREREIVQLVAQGYKNKEMAEKMFISEQTVKNHLHNIFDKLGISDRLELALYAIHKGLHLQQSDQ